MPTLSGMTSAEADQWFLNTDRRLHDLELYVLQLVDQNKKLEERVTALEYVGAGEQPGD